MIPFEPERYADGRPMLLAGLRRHHRFGDAALRIPEQWREFQPLMGRIPGQVGTTSYGAVCGSGPDGFEYMCAVEVDDFGHLPPDLGRLRVPAQHYAVFLHRGHISQIQATWERIWKEWLPQSGRRTANTPDLEIYDERFDPRTGNGEVEIRLPVEKDA